MKATNPPIALTLWFILVGIALALGAFGVAVLFYFNPSQHSFFPRCVMYEVTGLYCPGCGTQRALHHLLHGRLLTALHYNPLFVISLPFLFYAGVRFLWRESHGQSRLDFITNPFWIKLIAITVIAFAILRNIPCAPFNSLAPP